MKASRIAAVTLGVIVVAAGTVYVLAARQGFTINNLLHTTRVDITLFQVDRNAFILTSDDSIPFDACIHDGHGGDMYLFVQDCASRHPRLFAWSTSGEGRVRRGRQTLYGERPGPFTIHVRALGFTDSLAGEIVPAVSLLLSTYDTTLHAGEEIVVGSLLQPKTGEHVPVSSLELYDREQGNTIRLTRLDWAYPPAARITARQSGVGCLRLAAFNKSTLLRVAVVNAAGMVRSHYGKLVDPKLETCRFRGDRVTMPAERAPPPTPALADSNIAAGARKAFAYEVCMGRRRTRTGGNDLQSIQPDLEVCRDSVARMSPEWRLTIPRGGSGWSYSVSFYHPLSADGTDRREIIIDASEGTVTMQEGRLVPKFTYGPQARVQGDEAVALNSAVACLTLHRARTGRVPPSLDSLVAFARALRDTTPLGSPLSGKCDYDALRFRVAEHGTPPNSRAHESGLFRLRYTPRALGSVLVVRPLRYGETGVVSYRYEDPDRWRRTFENREPAPVDDHRDRERRIWAVPGAKIH